MSEQKVLLSELSEGVLTLTLNRPEALKWKHSDISKSLHQSATGWSASDLLGSGGNRRWGPWR